ncbi:MULTISPECIES: MarR family winged helix-turn-helix transcriptional regulator [unclassified Bradyrhizobium]|uniref:MarR family winged helix-turn-helix transcriptional regulator n=1 Tax=unclassified Bradyrhizobium TaxID=2631580 RepID=UPI0028F04B23|nr:MULTISPECIES: MarR family winged helix-turn-helix transcriptional regulator [unclassified Bradyrhizobium]
MTDDSDLYRLIETECPAFQARATARAVTRFYNACFRSLGITAEQFSLLVGIGGSHEPTLAELAARAGVDATTLSRNVKSLEQRGLVYSQGGLGRAGKRLVLTDKGRRLMEAAIVVWERARARLTDILGEEASHVARNSMSRLTQAAQTAASESSE